MRLLHGGCSSGARQERGPSGVTLLTCQAANLDFLLNLSTDSNNSITATWVKQKRWNPDTLHFLGVSCTAGIPVQVLQIQCSFPGPSPTLRLQRPPTSPLLKSPSRPLPPGRRAGKGAQAGPFPDWDAGVQLPSHLLPPSQDWFRLPMKKVGPSQPYSARTRESPGAGRAGQSVRTRTEEGVGAGGALASPSLSPRRAGLSTSGWNSRLCAPPL